MDNYNSVGNSLGAGVGKQLYHGRIYPYPSGVGRYFRDCPNHPGSENFVVKNANMRPDQKNIEAVGYAIRTISHETTDFFLCKEFVSVSEWVHQP